MTIEKVAFCEAAAVVLGPDETPYARCPFLFEFTFPTLALLSDMIVVAPFAAFLLRHFAEEHLSYETSSCQAFDSGVVNASTRVFL